MDTAVWGDDRPMEPEVTVPMAAQSAVLVPAPEAGRRSAAIAPGWTAPQRGVFQPT